MIKYKKIHLGASILACFWALEPVRGRLGDHPGMRTPKSRKTSRFGTFLWEQISGICWYFCGGVFFMFSEPLSFHRWAAIDTHGTQFRRLLATKFGTDWANMKKWKQWFRARGSINIKPQGVSICTDFVIFMYICSKPVFFAIPDLFLSHSSKFGYHFWPHFGQYIATNSNQIFKHKKCKRSESRVLLRQGYPGHITEEGGTRRHPGDPGDTQEAPRGTQRHPGGTQEAPRRIRASKPWKWSTLGAICNESDKLTKKLPIYTQQIWHVGRFLRG